MTGTDPKLTPPPSPPSPSASYYDVSDDEERGYNTIAQSSSGHGVKLLFSKSKVYLTIALIIRRFFFLLLTHYRYPGLHSSYSIVEGQHPWVYRFGSTKACQWNSIANYIWILFKIYRRFLLSSSMDPRISYGRRLRYLREG